MAYFKPPTPLKHDKGAGPGAGMPACPKSDIIRGGIMIPRGPMLQYHYANNRVNNPLGTNYSSILYPTLGLPYDTSKPRKGRRGETLGTKYSDLNPFLEDEWEKMKVPRINREKLALREAKIELERRIQELDNGQSPAHRLEILRRKPGSHRVTYGAI